MLYPLPLRSVPCFTEKAFAKVRSNVMSLVKRMLPPFAKASESSFAVETVVYTTPSSLVVAALAEIGSNDTASTSASSIDNNRFFINGLLYIKVITIISYTIFWKKSIEITKH